LGKNIINSLCRGKGRCGKCRIKILDPDKNVSQSADLSDNIQLACQLVPDRDRDLIIQILDLREYHDNIFKIQDTFSDFQLNFSFQPNIIKNELKPILGAVVDIGTTSIVLTIIDIDNGSILGADSLLNPQIEYGRDIMTRLSYALESPLNQKQLQAKAFQGISKLLKNVTSELGFSPENILEIIVVGNTVMHHLFLNLPIDKLAKAPFIPAISDEFSTTIPEVDPENIMNLPIKSIVTMPPIIGSFIGSDAVVDILYTELDKKDGIHLLIDFGTNSEIIITKNKTLYAASVAAGGAFEGQHINCGMRGIEGAIEKFSIINEKYLYDTINSIKAKGICGTGIIDILAELRTNNQLDYRGRLFSKSKKQIKKLILVPAEETFSDSPIFLTRSDVESVQKAKAATMTAIKTLLGHLNIEIKNINKVHISGVFGSKLNIQNAIKIGLLPDLPRERFKVLGNTAEKGARTILLSMEARKIARDIAKKVKRRELTTFPEFQSFFTEELFFPKNFK
jgi:uncharacterized 2Fe-2S/4Fe-4S cluster protein (DUF4445 family)